MAMKPSTLEVLLDVSSAFISGPVQKSLFSSLLSRNKLTLDQVEQVIGISLFDTKEDLVFLTDQGKEWFHHLRYLLGRCSLQSLLGVYHKNVEARLVDDTCSFIMVFMERLPKLESLWICSPWIVIGKEHRPRFLKCLGKVDRIQIITRPAEKTWAVDLRRSVEKKSQLTGKLRSLMGTKLKLLIMPEATENRSHHPIRDVANVLE